jgi:hypothetical protein
MSKAIYGTINPALRLRHTGRDRKVTSRAIQRLRALRGR